MSIGLSSAVAVMLVLLSGQAMTASGQEKITVTSLISDGYQVVSSFPTNIGPGVFLQKAGSLYVCFVSETPVSPDVKTNYCKPVH
jgi:hypothetical protein